MKLHPRIQRLIVAISIAVPGAACTPNPQNAGLDCEPAFVELVRSGQISSVNGIAIAPYYAFFVTTQMRGNEAMLVSRECLDGTFQAPRPLYPDTRYSDYQPTLSRDGRRIYFTSTRPLEGEQPVRQNVWMASRERDFAHPVPVRDLASPNWDGHAVEIVPDQILFASARGGEDRMVDIFLADFAGSAVTVAPVSALNSTMTDNDMAYRHKSGLLVFSRYDPGTKDMDLYYSTRKDGAWTRAARIAALSTETWDMSPAFSADGKYFLFMRAGQPFQIMNANDLSEMVRGTNAVD